MYGGSDALLWMHSVRPLRRGGGGGEEEKGFYWRFILVFCVKSGAEEAFCKGSRGMWGGGWGFGEADGGNGQAVGVGCIRILLATFIVTKPS